jgi:hypothetical protein
MCLAAHPPLPSSGFNHLETCSCPMAPTSITNWSKTAEWSPPDFDTDLRESFRHKRPWKEKEDAVKRTRFSVEQIVAVLKQAEMGTPIADLIRPSGLLSRRSIGGSSGMGDWNRSRSGSANSFRMRTPS